LEFFKQQIVKERQEFLFDRLLVKGLELKVFNLRYQFFKQFELISQKKGFQLIEFCITLLQASAPVSKGN